MSNNDYRSWTPREKARLRELWMELQGGTAKKERPHMSLTKRALSEIVSKELENR